jgi:RES domain-containing protein
LRELSSQDFGDRWIDSRVSAVLKVSSALVIGEHNYLLNPAHPDFVRLGVEPPAMSQFDARLFEGGGKSAG